MGLTEECYWWDAGSCARVLELYVGHLLVLVGYGGMLPESHPRLIPPPAWYHALPLDLKAFVVLTLVG